MKYYLIAGEASGDLHASHLIAALRAEDPDAQFRGFGGDLMAAEGMTLLRHYRELAYMGFVAVALHARTILRGMRQCREDIAAWRPDVVILVDYPGFNMKIAKFVHAEAICPVFYYIAPKLWAWKEWRIKALRRDVDELFSILPFEVEFFEGRHAMPIHYVGNPTVDEVAAFRAAYAESKHDFCRRHAISGDDARRPILAIVPGSRRQEVADNLPLMLEAAEAFGDTCQILVSVAPGIDASELILPVIRRCGSDARCIADDTYALLSHSTAALVTSGTATLETALFGVPQVVCYYRRPARLLSLLRRLVLHIPYVSLVNLIAGREAVTELICDAMTADACRSQLRRILPGGEHREAVLKAYDDIAARLGEAGAPRRAARQMMALLRR